MSIEYKIMLPTRLHPFNRYITTNISTRSKIVRAQLVRNKNIKKVNIQKSPLKCVNFQLTTP